MGVLIGITPDTHRGGKIKTRTPHEKIVYLWDRYLQALLDQGAMPVVLPVTDDRVRIREMVERLDGFVLAGGNFDVPPSYYRERPRSWMGKIKPERSRFELALLLCALERDAPVLGICGGMQIINVALGGSLYQDILQERPRSKDHEQEKKSYLTSHQVTILAGTRLHRIAGAGRTREPIRIRVNSTHHQSIKRLGEGLVVNAEAADGVIEGVEGKSRLFLMGVQWHPELLYQRHPPQERLLRAFVQACEKNSRRRRA